MELPLADVWYRLPTISRLSSKPILSFVAHRTIWHVGLVGGRWMRCWAGVYEGNALGFSFQCEPEAVRTQPPKTRRAHD